MKGESSRRAVGISWLRSCALEELMAASRPRLLEVYGCEDRWTDDGGYDSPAQWLGVLLESVRREIESLDDLPAAASFAYNESIMLTPAARETLSQPCSSKVLASFAKRVQALERTGRMEITALFRDLRAHFKTCYGMRGREVMFPLRAALTGEMRGPCLEVVVCLLGKGRTLERARRQLDIIMEAYDGAASV